MGCYRRAGTADRAHASRGGRQPRHARDRSLLVQVRVLQGTGRRVVRAGDGRSRIRCRRGRRASWREPRPAAVVRTRACGDRTSVAAAQDARYDAGIAMTRPAELDFEHVYEPPATASADTILLLHGTGGNERDLLPLGRMLTPGAALLSPRGKVLEHGMPRFFRRLAEGVFDEEDLNARTYELADFVTAAATAYRFDPRQVIAVGYSNGANIAASTLLLRPDVLAGGVL